ncbi:hypothetical protein [Rhodococcus qingshengii]|uniref:hypothetical protein n=1 Tax=Rhodococcus qingshengii TaxID=334542 RepID=UPI0012687BFE|nr:hypothetical protein [Rhodococcus qingshengii]
MAIVTPVELGKTALFAGAAGMLVLSILHNYVNIPQMAAAVRKDSQQWNHERSKKDVRGRRMRSFRRLL